MKLTPKEYEVMRILWNSKTPMTIPEIIRASPDRTWTEKGIYNIVTSMLGKEAVVRFTGVPTRSNTAKFIRPAISVEEYVAMQVLDVDLEMDIVAVFGAILDKKSVDEATLERMRRMLDRVKPVDKAIKDNIHEHIEEKDD